MGDRCIEECGGEFAGAWRAGFAHAPRHQLGPLSHADDPRAMFRRPAKAAPRPDRITVDSGQNRFARPRLNLCQLHESIQARQPFQGAERSAPYMLPSQRQGAHDSGVLAGLPP